MKQDTLEIFYPQENTFIHVPVGEKAVISSEREYIIMNIDRKLRGKSLGIPLNEAIAAECYREYRLHETRKTVKALKRRVFKKAKEWVNERRLKALEDDTVLDGVESTEFVDKVREAVLRAMGTTYVPHYPDPTKRRTHGVIISDLHGSWHPALPHILRDLNPEWIVIAGDIFDATSAKKSRMSVKRRPDYRMNLRRKTAFLYQELITVRALLEIILETTDVEHIHLMYGNHDANAMDLIYSLMGDPLLYGLVRDPFDVLTAGLSKNGRKVTHNLQSFSLAGNDGLQYSGVDYPSGYLALWPERGEITGAMDQILISHQNFTGAEAGVAVHKLWEWLSKKGWSQHLLNGVDLRAIVQAHTHKLSEVMLPGGMMKGFESGTVLHPAMAEYAGVNYLTNWTPSHWGMIVVQEGCDIRRDYSIDLNETHIYQPFVNHGGYDYDVRAYGDETLGNPFAASLEIKI